MFKLLIICLIILSIIIISEILWRAKLVSNELSRKLVHIGTAVLVAFLPNFVSYGYIQILSIGFLGVILLSLKFNLFKSIHNVKRVTLGEILYAVAIGLCASLNLEPWIFTVAILHLGLADALAALIGVKYGKKTIYTLFGHKKSWHGTISFIVVSFLIFCGVILTGYGGTINSYYLAIFMPLILSLVENFSWWGIDNLTIPVATIFLLGL